jgi:hypothetical protein
MVVVKPRTSGIDRQELLAFLQVATQPVLSLLVPVVRVVDLISHRWMKVQR